MQLFITNYELNQDTIIIHEERVVHQLTHVLRAKPGYQCMIQQPTHPTVRYTINITEISKTSITWTIIDHTTIISSWSDIHLCIALLNKFEKLELIVQKCVEIGITSIYFFVSQHSQLRDITLKKIERLQKIALEAVEQSYGYQVPMLSCESTLQELCSHWNNIVLYQWWQKMWLVWLENITWQKNFFVWPEWWWWEEDKKIFLSHDAIFVSLSSTILRTETAAILTAWEATKLLS